MAYAQGLGPANHKLIQFAIRKIFNSLDGITLRDRRSFELLKKTVNKSVHARISCDTVIGSRLFSPGNVKSLLSAKEPLNNNVNEYLKSPYIILSVRHSDVNHEKATSFYHNLSVCLTKFYQSAGFRFLLLPIQKSTKYADDRPVLKKLSDMLAEENVDTEVVQDLDNIFDAIALLQNAELVISNRLHALLLAASAGVPIYAISHQDKIQGCLEMLDNHDSCEIVQLNELSSEGCFPALTRLIKSTEESRKKLAGSVRTWSVNSIVNREVLTNLI
jgi:polysaccharide pyruvyl transferase WcaK-like protein